MKGHYYNHNLKLSIFILSLRVIHNMNASPGATFLATNEENGDFNQYWSVFFFFFVVLPLSFLIPRCDAPISMCRYSAKTIQRIVADITEQPGRIAFLSTPSLYFSLPETLRSDCYVFDVRFQLRTSRLFRLIEPSYEIFSMISNGNPTVASSIMISISRTKFPRS
jgi:hypothetical protein